ncbi:diacylglycerol/lipid kinase family protein [Lacticigenium naphthae]|uniref:diacylglycerol/lipid kinase family protein n=1 Tax=Lacticigenium naphthae TaxID=515351 RepID=UPI0004082E9A|nr:diacylglycerol kinase family protein [Lacticigenium naphthae]
MKLEKNIYFIVNESSGRLHPDEFESLLKKMISNDNNFIHIFKTEYPKHAITLASDIASKITQKEEAAVICAVGGDGTLNEVLNGVRKISSSLVLAYIPTGSGNDFARSHSFSSSLEKNIEHVLYHSNEEILDILHYENSETKEVNYAINSIGVGLDGSTIQILENQHIKEKLQRFRLEDFSYIYSLLKAFFRQKPFAIELDTENGKTIISDAILVVFTNHPFFGGGINISPKANPYSNDFGIVIARQLNFLQLLYLFALILINGNHLHSKHVHYEETNLAHLHINTQQPAQKDGESFLHSTQLFMLNIEKQNFQL